jgi:DNA-binding transcriptional regulator YbjK
MRDGKDTASLTATAFTENGSLYVSGTLDPYDVENLYEQFATLRRPDRGDVRVEVELGNTATNSPELRAFTRRMKRLRRHGVTVHLYATRSRKRTTLLPR